MFFWTPPYANMQFMNFSTIKNQAQMHEFLTYTAITLFICTPFIKRLIAIAS